MNQKLRVLHVEDSPRDVAMLTLHLKRIGYRMETYRVETAGAMKEALESREWDVILCDYAMPQFDALCALAVVKEVGVDLPFIIISGTIGEAVAVEAMRAGAHDYVMKDNLVRLGPAIEREVLEAANRRARRRVEEALTASDAELRALFAAMTDVIIVFNREGRHLRIAPSCPVSVYKPAAERIGKTLHEVFPEDKASFFLTQLNRAFESGCVQHVEYTLTVDGEERWFEGTVSPMSSESVLWVARDITARKQAENEKARLSAAVENQRERLDNIISSVPGVVWEAWGEPDADTQHIDFVSHYVASMLGYSEEEWLSTPNFWLQIVHPEDREQTARLAGRNYARGDSATMEFRWLAKDGRVLWVQSICAVVKDEAGTPIGTRGVVIDVSERRRTEAALRESEERYRDLVENAHDIIYSHNLDGSYTSVNKAGELITGYSREEALQLNFSQTIAPESFRLAQDMLKRKLAGEKITAYELELVAKDGHKIAVEVNSKLIYQQGVPVAVQGIARDVTKRKELESQLRQSQKMEAIGQLAGGVAHDFNNILTAINGYAALAQRRVDLHEPLKGYLAEIQKAGERAANLTRQLLAFGRKQMLQPVPLNLNDIVSDMNKMLRRLIGEDVQLIAKFDPALKKIKADPGQIEQVLVNLVVNARDAMPTGGTLTIETTNFNCDGEYSTRHVSVLPGKYVMLAVSDTGTGMDEKTRARVFEPFFTTKEKGKGTGLGLSTVYGIVKQSGGHVWVYSEPGRGTTFKVYLPQIEVIDEQSASQPEEAPPPAGSETILLVEDEDVVRNLTIKILEQAGYNVLAAGGAEEALQLCSEYTKGIDLLLTDVVMPATSGKEMADRLKVVRPATRVLFMSGYTDEAIVHHGVLDSNVEFIQKPFSPSALASKVRHVLDSCFN